MNAIKIVAETAETVTVGRDDWAALLSELEDAQDRAAVVERRSREAAAGKETARRDYLTGDDARRLLDGEHPVKVWREKRGLSQRALAEAAGINAGYLAEIETDGKPGSADALGKLAAVLYVRPEDLMGWRQRMRDPDFGPVTLRLMPSGSAGIRRGVGSVLERKEFRTLGAALDAVRNGWVSLRHRGPFITDREHRPIYTRDDLNELLEPATFRAPKRQVSRARSPK